MSSALDGTLPRDLQRVTPPQVSSTDARGAGASPGNGGGAQGSFPGTAEASRRQQKPTVELPPSAPAESANGVEGSAGRTEADPDPGASSEDELDRFPTLDTLKLPIAGSIFGGGGGGGGGDGDGGGGGRISGRVQAPIPSHPGIEYPVRDPPLTPTIF